MQRFRGRGGRNCPLHPSAPNDIMCDELSSCPTVLRVCPGTSRAGDSRDGRRDGDRYDARDVIHAIAGNSGRGVEPSIRGGERRGMVVAGSTLGFSTDRPRLRRTSCASEGVVVAGMMY